MTISDTVDTERFKERLLSLERDLTGRERREVALGQDQVADSSRDMGEASAAGETASESFAAAERDSTLLLQVREALTRIDGGTYGRCVVDGEPIEAARLNAVPWTQYCLKHQAQAEARP